MCMDYTDLNKACHLIVPEISIQIGKGHTRCVRKLGIELVGSKL